MKRNGSKKMIIGLDPGFDALKVVTPFKNIREPFFARQTTYGEYEERISQHDYIVLRDDKTGEHWEVGKYPKENSLGMKGSVVNESVLYTENRFQTEESKVVMLTGIALALLDENFKVMDVTPYIRIGLPHSFQDVVQSDVSNQLVGTHVFSVRVGNRGFVPFNITLKEENLSFISQSYASLISVAVDGVGLPLDVDVWDSNVLVVDGGFYTLGLLKMNRQKLAPGNESNTQLSMINAYKKACEFITAKTGRALNFWELDTILENYGGMMEYKDGKTSELREYDVRPLVEEAVDMYAGYTVEYIKRVYQDTLDIKKIIVTGGTGQRYFPKLKEAFKSKVVLAEDSDKKSGFSPVFAIAAGCYRSALAEENLEESMSPEPAIEVEQEA